MKRTIVIIIQARMGSTRLPGKMAEPIAGRTVLGHVIARARRVGRAGAVVVATSDDPRNDVLIAEARRCGAAVFAGSENDVLDRYYRCAAEHRADAVVRITGDCPLIDPAIVDEAIDLFERRGVGYVSNVNPPTYPDGMDVEVFTAEALERAWANATHPADREHVTPYIRRCTPAANLESADDRSGVRLTLDEPADLEMMRRLFEYLPDVDAPLGEILATLDAHPEIAAINAHVGRNEGAAPGAGQRLYIQARKLIPGGTQLLSKRPEMHLPENWPAYYDHARGCRVVDLDGKAYLDFAYMGVGANLLGYGDDDVDAAVRRAIDRGTMSTLNCPEEVELAELLTELHPWSSMVRYARTGGEAVAIAVRTARAHTGNSRVLFCGYHGWHDWYLAANLARDDALGGHLLPGLDPAGVPRELAGSARPFAFDDAEAFMRLIDDGGVAAVVMEPCRSAMPDKGFIDTVRRETAARGVVLIIDEITAGFRLTCGGAHLLIGVEPDIAVFGKGMSNGYAMSAVVGRGDVMQAAQSTFISSTYWTERIGPVAALATIRKVRDRDVPARLRELGEKVQAVWDGAAKAQGLGARAGGLPQLAHLHFDNAEQSLALKTLYTQLMLERGFLATTAYYASYAHTDAQVDAFAVATNEAFAVMAAAEREGVEQYLHGPVCHAGFKRLT